MNKRVGMLAVVGTLALTPSGVANAATLCARSGMASAAVYTPAAGGSCRTGETPIQTEPAAVATRQALFLNQVSNTFGPLTTPIFTTVVESGTYVIVASGVLQYPSSAANENAVVQCRLKKRDTRGQLSDALSSNLSVQTLEKDAYVEFAATATGDLLAGEGVEMTCQQYSAVTWKTVTVGFRELKLTAVKVSSFCETVVNAPQSTPK